MQNFNVRPATGANPAAATGANPAAATGANPAAATGANPAAATGANPAVATGANEEIKDAVAAYDLMPPPSIKYRPASMARRARRKKKEWRKLQTFWARVTRLLELRGIPMRIGSDPTTWSVEWKLTLMRLGWDSTRVTVRCERGACSMTLR